jgi:hypothetical protein
MRLSRPYSFSSDQTLGNHSPHPWGHGKPSEPPWDAPIAKLWCSKLKEGSISACSGCIFISARPENFSAARDGTPIGTTARSWPSRAHGLSEPLHAARSHAVVQ